MIKDIQRLNKLARRLLSTGEVPLPGEELASLSRAIQARAGRLYPLCGSTATEEAALCATLLMAYNVSAYGPLDREERVNRLLGRAETVLSLLENDAPERVHLLAWCFAEVGEESLLAEAEAIVAGWEKPLTGDRLLAADELALMREPLTLNV